MAKHKQSENENVFRRIPDLFENTETIKDTKINVQLKPRHYITKQKATPTRRCRTLIRETNSIRTSKENNRRR